MNDLVGLSTFMTTSPFLWTKRDKLYALNATYEVGSALGLWRDAEGFIAYIFDACVFTSKANMLFATGLKAHQEKGTRRIEIGDEEVLSAPRGDFAWIKEDPKRVATQFRDLALRQLSAMTCAFTEEARAESGETVVRESELWLPYMGWLGNLDSSYTLATFNYDVVVELAGSSNVHTVIPGDVSSIGKAQLLKLHGSVDWYREEQKIARTPNFEPALKHNRDPILGVPGREKHSTSVGLSELWDHACYAAEEAEAIVFMGYRFPPSDNYANKRILDAIRANKNRYLRVFVVLGPQDTPDVRRMIQLLAWACSGKGSSLIHNTRMFTQDVMLSFNKDMLLDREFSDARPRPGVV